MNPKDEHNPAYYDPDWEDPLDKAKKKYFQSDKGKDALKRYFQSDKGKAAFRRQYEKQKFVKLCADWLAEHPDKTVEDFLAEVLND